MVYLLGVHQVRLVDVWCIYFSYLLSICPCPLSTINNDFTKKTEHRVGVMAFNGVLLNIYPRVTMSLPPKKKTTYQQPELAYIFF